MESIRPYFAIAHIASQLFRTPFEVEELDGSLDHGEDLAKWSRADWRAFVAKEVSAPTGRIPWLLKDRVLQHLDSISGGVAAHLELVTRHKARYVLACDPAFPHLLQQVYPRPLGLSVIGELRPGPHVSVVGSRRAPAPFLRGSFELGFDLGLMGITVVSGGAFGRDIAVHQGVLRANQTPVGAIAVFAGGLGKVGPRGNLPTFRNLVASGGVLLSERLWGAAALPFDYPIRNRLISGLSKITVVMHVEVQSGAMVTCKAALDQGREVMVFDLGERYELPAGSMQLLEEGAFAITRASDLM